MKLVIDEENINELQVRSIKIMLEAVRNSHEIDVLIEKRKDGTVRRFQADWLKHTHIEE